MIEKLLVRTSTYAQAPAFSATLNVGFGDQYQAQPTHQTTATTLV
jgi:hypothetical protein